MREKKSIEKKKWGTTRVITGGIVGFLLAGGLLFFALFHVREIEVVGNTRYSDAAVKEMVLKGPLSANSVYLSVFQKHMDLSEVPFMNSVEVEMVSRNSIRLHVNEKQTIGYVEYAGMYFYFDTDGMVLECLSPKEAAQPEGNMLEPEEIKAEGETQYHPALTNVPLIEGLKFEWVEVDSFLEVPDKEVFNTILGISKMVDKFNIIPDSVEFSDEKGIILHYNKARVYLGEDENLEEKLTHLEAILPSICNLTGILHLENFSNGATNIIFTKDDGTDPADKKEDTKPDNPDEDTKPGDDKPKDDKPKDDKPGNTGTTNPPDEWES